jgi:hypothetical protein
MINLESRASFSGAEPGQLPERFDQLPLGFKEINKILQMRKIIRMYRQTREDEISDEERLERLGQVFSGIMTSSLESVMEQGEIANESSDLTLDI